MWTSIIVLSLDIGQDYIVLHLMDTFFYSVWLIQSIVIRYLIILCFCRNGQWMVLIDAAKGCSTRPPDLSKYPADFVAISFYKVLVHAFECFLSIVDDN